MNSPNLACRSIIAPQLGPDKTVPAEKDAFIDYYNKARVACPSLLHSAHCTPAAVHLVGRGHDT